MSSRPIVVFDLDGTLVDTAPDLLASLNHVISPRGFEPVDLADFRPFVGHGGRFMIERVFGKVGRAPEEDEVRDMISEFMEHYSATMPGASAPFANAVASVEALRDDGFLVAICTNKREANAIRLLELLGIANHFSAICGQDTFPVRKPDPGHLFGTIEMAGGNPELAVMVGDTPTDFDTAHAAGIPVVAVDFGYCHEPVSTFDPALVISDYAELTPQSARQLIAANKARRGG